MKIVKSSSVEASFESLKLITAESDDWETIIKKTLDPVKINGYYNQFTTILPLYDDAQRRSTEFLDFSGCVQPIVLEFDHDSLDHQRTRAEAVSKRVGTVSHLVHSGEKSFHHVQWFEHFADTPEEYEECCRKFYYALSKEYPDLYTYVADPSESNGVDLSLVPDNKLFKPHMYWRQANGYRPENEKAQNLTILNSEQDYQPGRLDDHVKGINLPDGKVVVNGADILKPKDDFQKVKDQVDLKKFIEKLTGNKFMDNGKMNPCPICSHKDCFSLHKDNKYWKCFSTEHDSGGTVIDFVIQLKNLSKGKALHWIAKKEGIKLTNNSSGNRGKKRYNAGKPSTVELVREFAKKGDIKKAVKYLLGHHDGLTTDGKYQIIAEELILPTMKSRGKFFVDKKKCIYYWFEEKSKDLYAIPEKSDKEMFELYLNNNFGINTKSVVDYIFKDLCTEARFRGTETEAHEFTYYDVEKSIAYVNRFDNRMYKTDGDTIDLCDNGTDGVLFLKSNTQPYEFVDKVDPGIAQAYLVDDINFGRHGTLTPEECKELFNLELISLFFPEVLKTKPIIILYGPKASGKSTALKRILTLFHGKEMGLLNVPKKQRDFETQLTRNNFVFFDNVDEKVSTWFKDGLASAATGYTIQMAQLYRTNEAAEFQVNPSIGICTRTANFGEGRDDIPDRSLVFHVKPIANFKDEGTLFDAILKNRNKIMSALLLQIKSVVKNLKETKGNPFTTDFRMADFVRFVHDGMPDKWVRLKTVFEKMKRVQSDLAAEGSLIYEVINCYLEDNRQLDGFLGGIFKKLQEFTKSNDMKFYLKNTFTKKFNSEKDNLKMWFDFHEEDTNKDGIRPKYNYSIKPKKDTNLVPGDVISIESQKTRLIKNDGTNSLKNGGYQDHKEIVSPSTKCDALRSASNVQSVKEYTVIDSTDKLHMMVKELEEAELISIDTETTGKNSMEADLVGFSISVRSHQGWYIPIQFSEKDRNLFTSESGTDIEAVAEILKPILEDPNRPKCGQNIVYDMIVLKRYGMNLEGIIFDTMIAEHLLIAGKNSKGDLKLDRLSEKFLNHNMIPIEELIGSGRKQKSMADVPLDQIAEYACEDADIVLQLVPILKKKLKERELLEYFNTVEIPAIKTVFEMQFNGAYVDVEHLRKLQKELESRVRELEKDIYTLAEGEFNINSSQQLSNILYAKLNLPVVKLTGTGTPSTDEDTLNRLMSKHPLPGLILKYRHCKKVLSTYIEPLQKQINPVTGRVHPSFNQTGTITGRFSSSNPNLQNIPNGNNIGGDIRKAFRPQSDGSVIFTADYSQIEIRVAAELSGDETLIQALQSGDDIHTKVAEAVFGESFEEADDEEKKRLRKQAKTATFGVLYGAGSERLIREFGMTDEEAKQFISAYFNKFPRILEYKEKMIGEARERSFVTTTRGRRRWLPDISSDKYENRAGAKRAAVNTPIQGTAAEITKLAMIRVCNRLPEEEMNARLIINVHDELVFEVDQDEVEVLEEIVTEEMKAAAEEVLTSIPVEVDCGIGDSWSGAH